MSRKRIGLRKIREILRLHFECGYSDRQIGRVFKMSHTTVGKIYGHVVKSGYTWPLPEDLDDAELERICYPPVKTYSGKRPLPDWNNVWKEMQRKGMTLQLLWQRYKDDHPDGYQYTQFCELYNRWSGHKKVTMRQRHRAGVNTFIDYAGSKLPLIDPSTGELSEASIFVSAAGAAGLIYAEATLTQQLPDWIASHIRMFEYYGGSTEILIPDNLKTGVKHPCRYEAEIMRTYENMARHYGAVVIPARVRKPKDKPLVENAVQQVLRWIIAVLRDRKFFSLAELNETISVELEKINNRPFTAREGSRRSVFKELDKPLLKPLPSDRFTYEEWKKVKVHLDYHVQVDMNYYSVPYQLVGRELECRMTIMTVEIFNRGKRVASHTRQTGKGHSSTHPEHMPPEHAAYLKMTPEKIMRWASRTGEFTVLLSQAILDSKAHHAQGYRAILGIMSLGRKYGDNRLETACGMALRKNSLRYRDVKSILKEELDISLFGGKEEEAPISHKNIRGAEYYNKGGNTC